MHNTIRGIIEKARAFEKDAHIILSKHESAKSRIITLDETYQRLIELSLYQENLFKESFSCMQAGLFKAAHVMAWAGFMDYLENKLISQYLKAIQLMRSKWTVNSVEDLRENAPEYQIITTARQVKLINKSEERAFKGLLNTRNECAHPSSYSPNLNETLGYISQLINRINPLQNKK